MGPLNTSHKNKEIKSAHIDLEATPNKSKISVIIEFV